MFVIVHFLFHIVLTAQRWWALRKRRKVVSGQENLGASQKTICVEDSAGNYMGGFRIKFKGFDTIYLSND